MVKLLHIGIEANTNRWLSKELRLRTDCREIIPFDTDYKIKALFDDHKPDLVFLQIQQANAINESLLSYMSKKAVLINWCGDVRDPIPRWYYDFDKYCITCFSNMRDVNEMKAEYLQIGIDADIYKKQKLNKINDIVFMGNWSAGFPLSAERFRTVDFLRKTYKDRFRLFGGWPGCNGNLMRDPHGEANIYAAAKIGISISHFNIDRYFSDRLIRIMGSGCLALSHTYPDMELDFQKGKHLDVFNDLDELKEKIDYYLTHDQEREEIAAEGCKLVHEKFTTRNMVNDIFRIYGNYKQRITD